MLAYKDALHIDDSSTEAEIAQAIEVLVRCENVVILNDFIALRPEPKRMLCEVVDIAPLSHRCAEEFAVLLENGQLALSTSGLGGKLPNRRMEWRVVKDHAAGTVGLWHPGRRY